MQRGLFNLRLVCNPLNSFSHCNIKSTQFCHHSNALLLPCLLFFSPSYTNLTNSSEQVWSCYDQSCKLVHNIGVFTRIVRKIISVFWLLTHYILTHKTTILKSSFKRAIRFSNLCLALEVEITTEISFMK